MDKELRNISNTTEYFSRVARCSFFAKEKRHFERTVHHPKPESPRLHEHIKQMKEQLLRGFLSDPKKKRSESINSYIRSIRTQPMLR